MSLGEIAARVASLASGPKRGPRPSAEELASVPFVFIIGFNKTATTSLHTFFARNGFPSVHWDRGRLARRMVQNCLDDRPILDGYDQKFRVFSDMQAQSGRIRIEANQYFRVLDRDYPGSYFILNTRSWWVDQQPLRQLRDPARRDQPGAGDAPAEHCRPAGGGAALDTGAERVRGGGWQYFRHNPRFLEVDIADPDLPERIARLIGRRMEAAHWKHIRTN